MKNISSILFRYFFFIAVMCALLSIGCNQSHKANNVELVKTEQHQKMYFNALMAVTENKIKAGIRKDSLRFLVLPLQASCPSCRKKVIDSITAHKNNLQENQYIILTSASTYIEFEGYFYDRKTELPTIQDHLWLDSANYALSLNLYDKKPTFYYAASEKVYKKVAALPETVKENLREFFTVYSKP